MKYIEPYLQTETIGKFSKNNTATIMLAAYLLSLYFVIEILNIAIGPIVRWAYVRDNNVSSSYIVENPIWLTENFNPISIQARMSGYNLNSAERGGSSASLNNITVTIPSVDVSLSSSYVRLLIGKLAAVMLLYGVIWLFLESESVNELHKYFFAIFSILIM